MKENKGDVFQASVVWFSAKLGYGFLTWQKNGETQQDLFVHFSDIVSDSFKTLKKDQKVQFSLGQNIHGRPKAIEVTVIDE